MRRHLLDLTMCNVSPQVRTTHATCRAGNSPARLNALERTMTPFENANVLTHGLLWRKLGGWTCLILGVAGLILPALPGVPLLIVGLVALSANYKWARICLRWTKRWMRKFSYFIRKYRSRRQVAT